MEEQWYVIMYDGKGNKIGGYGCKDAIHGLSLVNANGTKNNGFIYTGAACFYLRIDGDNPTLPIRQWFIEID